MQYLLPIGPLDWRETLDKDKLKGRQRNILEQQMEYGTDLLIW